MGSYPHSDKNLFIVKCTKITLTHTYILCYTHNLPDIAPEIRYAATNVGFPSRWRMFTCRKSLSPELVPAAIAFRSTMIIAYVPRDSMLRSEKRLRGFIRYIGRRDSYILTKLRYDRISPSQPKSNANVNYDARVLRERRERASFLALRYLRGNTIFLNLRIRYVHVERRWSMAVNVLDSGASSHEIVKSIFTFALLHYYRVFEIFLSLSN